MVHSKTNVRIFFFVKILIFKILKNSLKMLSTFLRKTILRKTIVGNISKKSLNTAKIYYDEDADLSLIRNKTIAILGYGSQGHAQAQNLRDSGCSVIVGQRPGKNYDLAKSHGFNPVSISEAVCHANMINILLPDEIQKNIYEKEIRDNLSKGDILMCSHGFNLHFGHIIPPKGVDELLIAPKGPGHLVRSVFENGGGVPNLMAIGSCSNKETFYLGLAYSKAIGGTKGGTILTTIEEETVTDLFGEQVVLCGGVTKLIENAFDVLTKAGYQEEVAYFECLHELKLIVDLLYEGGISYMRHSISNTAEYGDYTRGSRIITDDTCLEMKKILREIQEGKFSDEWMSENKNGCVKLKSMRKKTKNMDIEKIGSKLRNSMSWIQNKSQ